MFGEMHPKVCIVPGDAIRQRIRAQIASIERAVPAFELALLKNREGADWQALIDQSAADRKAAEWILPTIGDGPFEMTCSQWIALCNGFGEVRNADELLEERKKLSVRTAARQPPAGVPQ